MSFLFPEFLFAWLLMAIPVIIHLFNFRKFKKVHFTNIQFLKEVQQQTSAAQKLKEHLILACRMLAIFFLVMAFAQPYIKSSSHGQAYQKSVVSIYMDNSYSMEAVNRDGSLLDEGKRKIKELVDAYGLNDRFQLITNDFEGKQQRLLDKSELLDELNTVKIAPFVRSYQSIINRQQEILMQQHDAKRSIYLLSDFQKQDELPQKLKADSSISIQAIPLIANALPNISVDSVYFLSPIHQPQGEESLVVKIHNYADKATKAIPLRLIINNAQKALDNISLAAHQQVLDTLHFSGLSAGWQTASVSIKDYPITFDDDLNFTFEVKFQLPVLGIYQDHPIQNINIAYHTDTFFDFQEVNESQINYSDLSKHQLILLENLKSISSGLAQQLKQYVINGGNLSIFIPADADLSSYQQALQNFGTDYPVSLQKEQMKANKLNLQDPFFTGLFDKLPKNPDLPVASTYFKSSALTRTTQQVLITGEGKTPLLAIYPAEKGNIFISWMPLENDLSNLARHALFVPILFKMAFTGKQENPLFYNLGESSSINLSGINLPENEVIKIKNKAVEIVPEWRQSANGALLYFADQIKNAGFYDVIHQNQVIQKIAFNDNRKESNEAFYNSDDLESKLGIQAKNILNGKAAPINQQIKEMNLGSSLWKLCLILSIIFLVMEILIIRFLKHNIKLTQTIKSA